MAQVYMGYYQLQIQFGYSQLLLELTPHLVEPSSQMRTHVHVWHGSTQRLTREYVQITSIGSDQATASPQLVQSPTTDGLDGLDMSENKFEFPSQHGKHSPQLLALTWYHPPPQMRTEFMSGTAQIMRPTQDDVQMTSTDSNQATASP
jgi:hypothetical protein